MIFLKNREQQCTLYIINYTVAEFTSTTWYDGCQDPRGGVEEYIGKGEEDWASKSRSGW